jgi:hypothetical protein
MSQLGIIPAPRAKPKREIDGMLIMLDTRMDVPAGAAAAVGRNADPSAATVTTTTERQAR